MPSVGERLQSVAERSAHPPVNEHSGRRGGILELDGGAGRDAIICGIRPARPGAPLLGIQVLVPDGGRSATPPSDLIEIQVVKITDTTLVPEPPEPGSFHCALCPAAFHLVSELLFHEHGHLAGVQGVGQGGDPSRCHVCGHRCPGPASLRAHYSLHTGERPYRCPLCPRAFKTLAPLLRHQHRHGVEAGTSRRLPPAASTRQPNPGMAQERSEVLKAAAAAGAAVGKPFACRFCTKPFRRSSDMRDHERVHTGERPYHCAVCGKGFTQSSVLSGHARIHTGERPFRCTLCARTFNNSSNFRKHQRTHFHGPGPGVGESGGQLGPSWVVQDSGSKHGTENTTEEGCREPVEVKVEVDQ